jgi:hypothetical protein
MNDINQRICRKLGICYHEADETDETGRPICKHCKKWMDTLIDDFTDDAGAVELLRIMMRQGDWPEFCEKIGYRGSHGGVWDGKHYNPTYEEFIEVKYVTTPGALAEKVDEFLPEKEEV